jgi:hypothetical protein
MRSSSFVGLSAWVGLSLAGSMMGCGGSGSSPPKPDAYTTPAQLQVPGEKELVSVDSHYALIYDDNSLDLTLLPIPASGINAGAPLDVGVPSGNNALQWVPSVEKLYWANGTGSTGVALNEYDPSSQNNRIVTTSLSDLNNVSAEFSVSKDGNWLAYLTQVAATTADAGPHDASTAIEAAAMREAGTTPDSTVYDASAREAGGDAGAKEAGVDAGVGEAGSGKDAAAAVPDAARVDAVAPSDAQSVDGAGPTTTWDLMLAPLTGTGSPVVVATNVTPTAPTIYFFTSDSKYLVLAQGAANAGVFSFEATSVAAPTTMQVLSTQAAGSPLDDGQGNLLLVTSYTTEDSMGLIGTGTLTLFPGVLGTPVTIDTGVDAFPALSNRTFFYVKGAVWTSNTAQTKGDVYMGQLGASGLVGTPTRIQTGTAMSVKSGSPDGKWLSFGASYAVDDTNGFYNIDANIVSTSVGATPLNLGMVNFFEQWAPDSSSYLIEHDVDTNNFAQAAAVSLSGTTPTKNADFSSTNYWFFYKDAAHVVYDTNANETATMPSSDWVSAPLPTGMPQSAIWSSVPVTYPSSLLLVPSDNTRAVFVMKNQSNLDGLYLVSVP